MLQDFFTFNWSKTNWREKVSNLFNYKKKSDIVIFLFVLILNISNSDLCAIGCEDYKKLQKSYNIEYMPLNLSNLSIFNISVDVHSNICGMSYKLLYFQCIIEFEMRHRRYATFNNQIYYLLERSGLS